MLKSNNDTRYHLKNHQSFASQDFLILMQEKISAKAKESSDAPWLIVFELLRRHQLPVFTQIEFVLRMKILTG